ncbi:hypothetical protein LTS15_006974, partial [Exophiala xenobiotica]
LLRAVVPWEAPFLLSKHRKDGRTGWLTLALTRRPLIPIPDHVISEMKAMLLNLHRQGTPPADVMRAALDKVIILKDTYGASDCNILILNLNQLSQTQLNLHGLRYHGEFRLQVWPVVLRYGIWIFGTGTVDHTAAEGGWNNWSMAGRFQRSGRNNGYVVFS